jgi:hypothetical protein
MNRKERIKHDHAHRKPGVALSQIEVGELMRAWIENVYASRLTIDLRYKLHEWNRPVRALLAQRNRAASDAMWADDYLRARELMMKNGLPDYVTSPFQGPGRELRKNRKEMQANTLTRSLVKVDAQKRNGTHWQTVK